MKNFHTITFSALLATLVFSVLGAQEKDQPVELLPYRVTAYHFEAPAIEVPTNVTLITADDIQRQAAFTLAEVLEQQAGLHIRSFSGDPAQATLSMRGFGEASGQRALVLVDGKRLNRPDLGRTELETIPLQAIEEVEVLRGSWTTLYGDHAVGGVIKITTRRDAGTEGGNLTLQGGSYGRFAARGSYWNSIDAFDYAIDTEYNRNGGYRENSRSNDHTLHANFGFRFNALWNLRVEGTYKDSDNEFPGDLTETLFLENPRQSKEVNDGVGDDNFGETDYYATSGTLTYDTGNNLRVELEGGWQLRDIISSLREETPFAFTSLFDNRLTTVNFSPKVNWESGPFSLVSGFDLWRDQMDVRSTSINFIGTTVANADVTRRTVAGYGHARYAVSPQLLLSGGIRIEDNQLTIDSDSMGFTGEESNSEANWSGQLGLTFMASEDLRFWTRYDRLYRFPATDELAAYQGFALADVFNEDLGAEIGGNVEVGGEYTFGDLRASAAVFYQKLSGEIAFDSVNFLNSNLNDTRRLGFEAGIDYRMDPVRVGLNYNGIETEFTDGPNVGSKVPLVPWHKLSLYGEWAVIPSLTLRGDLVYTSQQISGGDFANDNDRMDSYTTVDFLIRWEPVTGLRIFVAVNNAFDANYSSFVIRDPFTTAFYPAMDRNFRGGVNWSF